MEPIPPSVKKRKYLRICMDQIAHLSQGLYQENVFLFDISLKGVCFTKPTNFDLVIEYPCILGFEHQKPSNKPIQMKISLVRINHDKVGAFGEAIDVVSLKRLCHLIEHYSFQPISIDDIKL